MFADAECREYATGELSAVYVRLNQAFGFGEGLHLGSGDNALMIVTPTQSDPDNPYYVTAYTDFMGEDQNEPLQSGAVLRCEAPDPVDVTEYRTIWYGTE